LAAIAPLKMRLLIALLFISFIGHGVTLKRNKLIGEWIGVNPSKLTGLILDFRSRSELHFGAIGTDSTANFKYSYNKSSGKITVNFREKKETFGKLERVTADRMTILTDDSTRLEFARIRNVKLGVGKTKLLEQLKNSSWSLKQDLGIIRMDFLTTHRWDDDRQPLEAMFHYWYSTPYKEKEMWNVGEYNGKLLMYFTNFQTWRIIQQVMDVSSDKIVLVSLTSEDPNQVQIIERTKAQPQDLIEKLTTKRWTSIHLDTTFCDEWGQIGIGNRDVKELQLLLKMEFQFNSDKSYTASLNGDEWMNGQWKPTSDGAYIILDDARDNKNWIEVQREDSNLVLTKLQQIRDGESDYKLYLLTIRLE
jgi:hypothetical protein